MKEPDPSLMRLFQAVWLSRDVMVSHHAVVDEGAEIGKSSYVWHFSHVMDDARVGRKCTLGQNVFIDREVGIGDRVKIQNNVSVYRGVTLEDDVFVGPSAVFTNVRSPRCEFPKDPSEYGRTLVRRGATIGANATIVCGVTVGEHAFVGAGAVVTKDVPPFTLVTGVPATENGWICRCGLKITSRERDCGSFEFPCSCGRVYHYDPGSQVLEAMEP